MVFVQGTFQDNSFDSVAAELKRCATLASCLDCNSTILSKHSHLLLSGCHPSTCRIQNTLHEVQLLRAKSHGVPDTADSSSVEDVSTAKGAFTGVTRKGCFNMSSISRPTTSRS